jgi:S-adenosylmethionine:tRNA ribosyltransferase-isomerase
MRRMQASDFHFDLPAELIAQEPLAERSASRLLRVTAAGLADLQFADLPGQLRSGDLLVLNDTRVIPARLFGQKSSGGKIEVLLERILDEHTALVQMRSSKSPKPGAELLFGEDTTARLLRREGSFFVLQFSAPALMVFNRLGHMPLPPYIDRPDTAADADRYQTVFSAAPGAVAAPTAGLHFDAALLEKIAAANIEIAKATLHVGAGTFQPVRQEQIDAKQLHSERVIMSQALCDQVAATRERGGRVVAVGTTVMRCLETAAQSGELAPFNGETSLFIQPGYRFNVVDAMVTNFHLPESSLLMLVSAFAGTERILAAYRHAVAQRYRFFSYGDAMFLERSA